MKAAVLLCLAVVILGGCDNKPPAATEREVNDRNCQIEEIKRIEDKAMRATFAGLCARRSPSGGGIAPTQKPINLLDLADPSNAGKRGTNP